MRRILSLLFALLVTFSALQAQQPVTAQLDEALKNYRAKNYVEAYKYFSMAFANDTLQAYMAENNQKTFTQLGYRFARSGFFVAKNYYDENTKSGRARCREICNEVAPYAIAHDKKIILTLVALCYYKDALSGKDKGKIISSLQQARTAYHTVGDTLSEAKMLRQIASFACDYWTKDKVSTACHEAESVAQTVTDVKKRYSLLCEICKVAQKNHDNEYAYSLTTQINAMKERYGFEDHYITLMSKGDAAYQNANYALAINYYRQAEPLTLKEGGLPEITDLYIGLFNAYTQSKQYDKALAYANSMKRLEQTTSEKNEEPYYAGFANIARTYLLMGDSAHCFEAMDSLFLGLPYSESKSGYYTQRGLAYARFQCFERALADFERADELRAQSGEDYNDLNTYLLSLKAGANYQLKHYDEAERLYARYLEECRRVYPNDKSKIISATIYLANAEAFAGHIDAACAHYVEGVKALKDYTQTCLENFTTDERETYWNDMSEPLLNVTPFAIAAGKAETDFTSASYDALSLTKSFLLDTEHAVRDIVKQHGSTHDQQVYENIEQLRLKIKDWQRNETQYADSLVVGYRRLNAMESELMRSCSKLGEITKFMAIGYDEVKARLGANDVLLDFTDYSPNSRGRVYAAYVVKKDQQFPLLRELFAESALDSLHVTAPQQYYAGTPAEQLLQRLWTPLSGEVKEGSTVYYVPSQLLYQVAIESLPLADGTLLGDHYHFVRLSSSRELVRYAEQLNLSSGAGKGKKSKPAATLYGGLQYDVDLSTMALEASKSTLSPFLAQQGWDNVRGAAKVFRELPASRLEVESIAKTLSSNGFDVNLLTRTAGTEESFLALSDHAPQLLHIATHGFYYTPTAAAKVNYLRGYNDAMSLSGLVLSGGNAGWRGVTLPDGVLGGVLTASGIARLNLEGTQLAVLSACQTGQGEVTPEGLYGLHRAFKKAGVQSLVMTLWSVNDAATSLFMTTFYDALAKNAWGKHRAFRLAQSAVRTAYPEPFYWASFVMVD